MSTLHPLHAACKADHAATQAAADPMPATHMWKVTHISEGGASHTQLVIAASNALADEYMARQYGLPLFSSALRVRS